MIMEVLQVPSELDSMLDLYRERKPKRVLEIGCWDGGTLREWLQEGTPEIVVAVDLEHRNSDSYHDWRKPETDLVLYYGRSQDAHNVAAIGAHAPYDWVFVDGDHGLEAVTADVETCVPLIREGGLMLLHDIDGGIYYDGDYGPRVVLETFRDAHEVVEFVDPDPVPQAHGIGAVYL